MGKIIFKLVYSINYYVFLINVASGISSGSFNILLILLNLFIFISVFFDDTWKFFREEIKIDVKNDSVFKYAYKRKKKNIKKNYDSIVSMFEIMLSASDSYTEEEYEKINVFIDSYFSQDGYISTLSKDNKTLKKQLMAKCHQSMPSIDEVCNEFNEAMFSMKLRSSFVDTMKQLATLSKNQQESEKLVSQMSALIICQLKDVEYKPYEDDFESYGGDNVDSLLAYHIRQIGGNVESEISLAKQFLNEKSEDSFSHFYNMLFSTEKIENWRVYCLNILHPGYGHTKLQTKHLLRVGNDTYLQGFSQMVLTVQFFANPVSHHLHNILSD